jgi:branched-chain amino acid transport system ATP-binding protein
MQGEEEVERGLLETVQVEVRYRGLPVVQEVSISVAEGHTACVLGANGAGKSSLLRGIMGAQRVSRGKVLWEGREIQGFSTERIVGLGIVYVPEERMLFGPLSVEENLRLGAYLLRDRVQIQRNLSTVYGLFPRLRERSSQAASTLSGGEQQMLAIGRGLMSNPRLLMLDEPSLGLAPLLVSELLGTVRRLKEQGMTILLVEQNVKEALELADRGYVLQAGRMVLDGTSSELISSDLVRKAYLGL